MAFRTRKVSGLAPELYGLKSKIYQINSVRSRDAQEQWAQTSAPGKLCYSHITTTTTTTMNRESVHTPLLDRDELKMALRTRKVSGNFTI